MMKFTKFKYIILLQKFTALAAEVVCICGELTLEPLICAFNNLGEFDGACIRNPPTVFFAIAG